MEIFKDANFDSRDLEIINLCPALAHWFERNSFLIGYFEFNKGGYDFEETDHYNPELKLLKDMVKICLVWLNSKGNYTDSEKALKAAMAISKMYEENKGILSDEAKETLKIDLPIIDYEFAEDVLNPPDLLDMKKEYLNKKKQELLNQISVIDNEINEIDKEKANLKI